MKARYVKELTQGTRVDAAFVVRSKDLRVARNGDAFLTLELADRSGSIPAVLFRPDSTAVAVPVGGVAHASGSVTTFRGSKRVSLDVLRPAASWDPSDLIASSPRPSGELVDELRALVRSVRSVALGRLLRSAFGDKELFESFCRCPASVESHHAYLGGLLEHTVAVATTCASAAGVYAGVDRDLLLSAALLHDVGRIDELTCDTAIGLTDAGRLLGHSVLGAQRVRELGGRARVDAGTLARLEHAILAHHAGAQAGISLRPATIEAIVLRNADALDADAASFALATAGTLAVDEAWTGAGNVFERPLYAPSAQSGAEGTEAGEREASYLKTA